MQRCGSGARFSMAPAPALQQIRIRIRNIEFNFIFLYNLQNKIKQCMFLNWKIGFAQLHQELKLPKNQLPRKFIKEYKHKRYNLRSESSFKCVFFYVKGTLLQIYEIFIKSMKYNLRSESSYKFFFNVKGILLQIYEIFIKSCTLKEKFIFLLLSNFLIWNIFFYCLLSRS